MIRNFWTQIKTQFNWQIWMLLTYFALGLVALWNHAMWRDELNVWTIARDSETLANLWSAIRYEGHPGLWYIMLFGVSQVTHHPFAMQFLHLCIGTVIASLILLRSPFLRWQKISLIFGYFFFFEYLVLSRNYSLGILSLITCCAIWETRKKSYLLLAIALIFGANSSAYALFLTIAIALTLLLEYTLQKRCGFQTQASRLNVFGSGTLYLAGVGLSLWQLWPPQDSFLHGGDSLNLQFDFAHLLNVLHQVWISYVVIITPGESPFDIAFFAAFSLVLLSFFSWILRDRSVLLFLYILGNVEILGFAYLKFSGGLRHYGHLYILLIICLWLSHYYSVQKCLNFKPTQSRPIAAVHQNHNDQTQSASFRFKKTVFQYVFGILLGLQLMIGILTYINDFITPYSASKATAQFLQRQNLDQLFIVGSPDMTMTPISGYLNQKIYYPETQDWGSFVLFNSKRREVDQTEILQQVEQLLRDRVADKKLLLILNQALQINKSSLEIEKIRFFPDGVIHDEEYHIYQVQLSYVTSLPTDSF